MSMLPNTGAAPHVDPNVPSIARSYDAVLGGKDNYEIDREVRDQLLATAPELGRLAWDNRGFLIRVTRYLAGTAGIDQFIDCGSGLPTVENTHDAARRVNRGASVVYVDNDPVVAAHGRALLEDEEHTWFVADDLAKPDQVLAAADSLLELDRPVALYQVGTLHHLADAQDPARIMRDYIAALPAGSYVVASHFYNPGADDQALAQLAERLEDSFLQSPMGTGRFRTRDEITSYFGDLDIVEPGVVTLTDWWPDGPPAAQPDPVRKLMIGGIAHKPLA